MKCLWLRLAAFGFSPAAILGASSVACHAADFYVATNGNDSNLGTIAQPFATVGAAVSAARVLGTNTTRNIIIRGGEYFNVAVLLQRSPGADDSGLTIQGCPNEVAKLYGGMLITNWSSVSNGWYAAPLPTYPASLVSAVSDLSDWQVRMLLVDGNMAVRAQYPTNAYSLFYTDTNGTATLHYSGTDLGQWLVLTNAEIQVDFSWDQQTTGATAIDTNNKAVTLFPVISNESGLNTGQNGGVNSYRVYNIAQGMSSPGQFFYDRGSRSIVYWPIGGKDPNISECIVPTTTRVFYIAGEPWSRPWGITFSNLTIAVSTMDIIAEGGVGQFQGNSSLINAFYCDGLVMDEITLGPTAGNGLGMDWTFSTNTILRNSEIYNCGAWGASIAGGPFVISNNVIHSIGNICYQSPGIYMIGDAPAVVTHNTIFDCKMSGIDGYLVSHCAMTYNSFSNCMQVLRDHAAIYTSTSTNNVIAWNLFQHIGGHANTGADPRDWGRFGIYCDDFTSGYQIFNNVTLDVPRPLLLNDCYLHNITNNFFIDTSDIVKLTFVSLPANWSTTNITFTRNVIYSITNVYVEYLINLDDADNNNFLNWSSNILYSATGGYIGLTGIPTNAVTLDPEFVSLSPLNPSFQAGSPAPGLGILPLVNGGIGSVASLRPPPPTNLRFMPR